MNESQEAWIQVLALHLKIFKIWGAYIDTNTLGSIFLYLKKRSLVTFNLTSYQTLTFSFIFILGYVVQCSIEHI